MSDHLDQAKRYHEAIRAILLHDWDPIGVSHVPEAQDEYDGYIHEIHLMLIRREGRHVLIDHLWWIETVHMGLHGNHRLTEAIADRLIRLRDEFESAA